MTTKKEAKTDLSHLCGKYFSIQFSATGERYSSYCRGVIPGRFLIVQKPEGYYPGQQDAFGGSVTVRYIHDGIAYGFRTEIKSCQYLPVQLLYLGYPDDIEAMELRASRRIGTVIIAVLKTDYFTISGVILNLSSGGCMMVLTRGFDQVVDTGEIPWDDIVLDEEEAVSLSFSISQEIQRKSLGSSVMLEDVKCRVRKVQFEEEHVHINLEFEDTEAEAITRCARYVEAVAKVLPG